MMNQMMSIGNFPWNILFRKATYGTCMCKPQFHSGTQLISLQHTAPVSSKGWQMITSKTNLCVDAETIWKMFLFHSEIFLPKWKSKRNINNFPQMKIILTKRASDQWFVLTWCFSQLDSLASRGMPIPTLYRMNGNPGMVIVRNKTWVLDWDSNNYWTSWRQLVSSVGRASDYHVGGQGFEPQTGPAFRVFK